MWPPISSARSEAPASVNHWLPASSISSTAPVPCERRSAGTRAPSPTSSVHATRCAPFSSPVSSRSSSSSATVRPDRAASARLYNGSATVIFQAMAQAGHAAAFSRTTPNRAVSRERVAARPRRRSSSSRSLALWGLWELYRWIWVATGWTWPFPVNDTTMPHLHTIVQALGEPARSQGPLLITVLLHAAWFTGEGGARRLRDGRRPSAS